jgi:hypothetical protein
MAIGFGVASTLLKRNKSTHWIAQGRTLAVITAVIGLGSPRCRRASAERSSSIGPRSCAWRPSFAARRAEHVAFTSASLAASRRKPERHVVQNACFSWSLRRGPAESRCGAQTTLIAPPVTSLPWNSRSLYGVAVTIPRRKIAGIVAGLTTRT